LYAFHRICTVSTRIRRVGGVQSHLENNSLSGGDTSSGHGPCYELDRQRIFHKSNTKIRSFHLLSRGFCSFCSEIDQHLDIVLTLRIFPSWMPTCALVNRLTPNFVRTIGPTLLTSTWQRSSLCRHGHGGRFYICRGVKRGPLFVACS
jgi:hypothetical protein